MTVKELIECLAKLPEDHKVYLCDVFDDREEGEGMHPIVEKDVCAMTGEDREGNKKEAVIICFENSFKDTLEELRDS